MQSMKYIGDDFAEKTVIANPERPEYPYCLRIRLDDEQLKLLGVDELPEIDKVIKIKAIAKVCSVSQSEGEFGSHKCLELQITDMELGMAKSDSQVAKKLYE